ncbi:MAG: restriction endonuclease subunit S [Candidatus Nitrosopelagicus sp.]|nr:restriction endonuclease subunit S [Candidatus Nitrosopelagicus sp.]
MKLENAARVSEEVYENFTKNHKPQRNDIVMSRVGTYFVTSFVNTDEQFCMGQNTLVIHSSNNSLFLYFILNSIFVKKQIEILFDMTTGQKTLSLKNIRNLKIFLPPLPEQQKTASILSNTDEKIQSYERYKEKLQNLKTSLMQKLLTGEVRVAV